jgi:hypothetical protein
MIETRTRVAIIKNIRDTKELPCSVSILSPKWKKGIKGKKPNPIPNWPLNIPFSYLSGSVLLPLGRVSSG